MPPVAGTLPIHLSSLWRARAACAQHVHAAGGDLLAIAVVTPPRPYYGQSTGAAGWSQLPGRGRSYRQTDWYGDANANVPQEEGSATATATAREASPVRRGCRRSTTVPASSVSLTCQQHAQPAVCRRFVPRETTHYWHCAPVTIAHTAVATENDARGRRTTWFIHCALGGEEALDRHPSSHHTCPLAYWDGRRRVPLTTADPTFAACCTTHARSWQFTRLKSPHQQFKGPHGRLGPLLGFHHFTHGTPRPPHSPHILPSYHAP